MNGATSHYAALLLMAVVMTWPIPCRSYGYDRYPHQRTYGRVPCGRGTNHPCPRRSQDSPYVARETAGFSWRRAWTKCSTVCGNGTQQSVATCEDGWGRPADPYLCTHLPMPDIATRPCHADRCPLRWRVGNYGNCSAECGSGRRERTVQCLRDTTEGGTVTLPDAQCPQPPPPGHEKCRAGPCMGQWRAGQWGKCSVTCGVGVQKRRVRCVVHMQAGTRSAPKSSCLGPPPHKSRSCSPRDCLADSALGPVIQTENYTLYQWRRVRGLTVGVGGRAWLLPGQTVSVECPVSHYPRRLLFWSKGLRLVPMVGRVRVSFYGNLKIRKADPEQDAGVYTCMAGPEFAEVKVEFLTRKEAKKRKKEAMRWTREDTLRSGDDGLEAGTVRDGGDNVTRPAYLARRWSPCSVTCGHGRQTRQVTCAVLTARYMKEVEERQCTQLGLVKPDKARKCSIPCPDAMWTAGQWSKCSLDACFQRGRSRQHRDTHCAFANTTLAPSPMCKGQQRPKLVRTCVNRGCVPYWKTSKWSACHPRCVTKGRRVRMLTCLWRKSGLPAWRACHGLSRPKVRKSCQPRPCGKDLRPDCVDGSRYCSLAGQLNMCRYHHFSRQCCRSCHDHLQSTLY